MKRDPSLLTRQVYDVLIIGGGVYGACVAWDAALRGLSVALVEKGDFAGRTSANNLKIIHGGLRYLQQADIGRMRHSIRERKILMRIAPHLVHPLPCLMPTSGWGLRSRPALAAALWFNDVIGWDRNGLPDPGKFMPAGQVISKEECLRILPGLHPQSVTGAAVWHDGVMHSPERVTLSFVSSAVARGAHAVNYVRVKDFLREGSQVVGAAAEDVLTGRDLAIRARLVVNAAGPWVNAVLAGLPGRPAEARVPFTKAMNLVIGRPIVKEYAVAVYRRSGPVYFIVPWRGRSLVGTAHLPYDGDPDQCRATEREIMSFLCQINRAYPAANLRREDVVFTHAGLLPGSEDPDRPGQVGLMRHYRLVDHEREDGVRGVVSVVGVKFTTARGVAEKTVDLVLRKLGRPAVDCQTADVPVWGGNVPRFDDFLASQIRLLRGVADPDVVEHWVRAYGAEYPAILEYQAGSLTGDRRLCDAAPVTEAEIRHAVRREMAVTLTDAVMRRTGLGTLGFPGEAALERAAGLCAEELGWTEAARVRQLDDCLDIFATRAKTAPPAPILAGTAEPPDPRLAASGVQGARP
jgi:glycerol-3-phosphate dehydrogenase